MIFVIEEPELYQHPDRQRHLCKVLQNLADGKVAGISEITQVIYSTHSPHFVTIERFENIRLLRKVSDENGKPKVTKIREAHLDEIAEEVSKLDYNPDKQELNALSLLPKLHAIMTPWMNEGFFSDVVILVEGEEDRAALLGVAESEGVSLESMGFSVIPCYGKQNFDKPTIIFRELGIPVYIIWDGDYGTVGADPRLNHKLCVMMNCLGEDWPSHISENHACFKTDLEETLMNEIGIEFFERSLAASQEKFGISKRRRAVKNPFVVADIILESAQQGRRSKSIQQIVDKLLMLKHDN